MAVPLLWLYGPPGVGKTTVAWELFGGLTAPAAFVDIDQLGMCYAPGTADEWAPEPASDPGRHRMKARNLDAVAGNFGAAGARCVVVPGVVDAERGVAPLTRAAVVPCRLRADPADLRRRLAGRRRPMDRVYEILSYAAALDRLPGPCVDTTGLSVAEVVRLVRAHLPSLEAAAPSARLAGPVTSPGEILLLCGPTAVGKSAVGWQIYMESSRAGVRTAFADLQQIGFTRPASDHRLKAANLAAMWQTYAERGARRMVVVGRVGRAADVAAYGAALPATTITVCRLRASPDRLTERVMMRGRGEGVTWGLAGDDLTGQPPDRLRAVPARAAAEARALDRSGIGDLCVDTDHRAVADIVEEIRAFVDG